MKPFSLFIIGIFYILMLSSCGYRGDLYLPDQKENRTGAQKQNNVSKQTSPQKQQQD